MPLTRFIVELYNIGIYVYFMNGIFSFKKIEPNSKLVTLKISELNEYMHYLSVGEFVTMIENRLQ
jgi:hypothetical protein